LFSGFAEERRPAHRATVTTVAKILVPEFFPVLFCPNDTFPQAAENVEKPHIFVGFLRRGMRKVGICTYDAATRINIE
jgi:hypothetical protein